MGTWKIIRVSNFDHEDWRGDQYVVAEYIAWRPQADVMCEALNARQHEQSDDYFRVVSQGHVLRKDWAP